MDFSIVILTYNAGKKVVECLDAIFQQDTKFSFEVICIDSGSSDETLEFCKRYPVKLFSIAQTDFNHGLTRNFGAKQAQAEFIVFITQDAVPVGRKWLENLVLGFYGDEQIAGIYCRQIPNKDVDFLTKRRLASWLTGRLRPEVSFISDRTVYDRLSPFEKYKFCNFDNVCSVVRKSVLLKFPFEKTYFAEDLGWSKKALEAGYKIMYQPDAVVMHSHKSSVMAEYRRAYLCHQKLRELFDLALVPNFWCLIKYFFENILVDTFYIFRNDGSLIKKIALMFNNFFVVFASMLAQYQGASNKNRRY